MSFVRRQSAGNAACLSDAIWADFPSQAKLMNPSYYVDIWEDFLDPAVTDTSLPGWALTGTNADIDNVADVVNGEIVMNGTGADNDSCTIFKKDFYLLAKNNRKKFWFEARVKLAAAGTADDFAVFVGLVESVGATAELIADDGATIIDEDHIGFKAISNATTIQDWDATANQGGSANFPVDIEADTAETSTSYVKLGMRFDGKQTVTFYVNGAKTTTYDIDNLDNDTLAHEVGPVIGIKDTEGSAALTVTVDWVRFACEKIASGY